jgi:hypothetical protein
MGSKISNLMLFATVCFGPVFNKRYSYQVNEVGKTDTVYVLTDRPDLFPNCITRDYTKFMGHSQFTYYSKLLFLFSLLEELKERVNYVDADFLKTIFNKELVVGNTTLFTSKAVPYNKTLLFTLDDKRHKYREWYNFLDDNGLETKGDNVFTYITEAFWSFPYLENINEIASRARELQAHIEKIFTTDPKHWAGTPLKRYAETGVGFGEGTAMSALVQEFNIPFQAVNHNKDLFNKKKFLIL